MRILVIALLIVSVVTTGVLLLVENSNKKEITDLLIKTEMSGVTRGAGNTYTTPITIKGKDIYRIGSRTWLTNDERLPIILQIISSQGEVTMTLASNEKGITLFTLPQNTLCHKNGYTLKIKDQLNRILIKSQLIVLPCKGMTL
jgi:hypothetical protein